MIYQTPWFGICRGYHANINPFDSVAAIIDGRRYSFCLDGIREYFDIPRCAKQLRFNFYRPGAAAAIPDSYYVQMVIRTARVILIQNTRLAEFGLAENSFLLARHSVLLARHSDQRTHSILCIGLPARQLLYEKVFRKCSGVYISCEYEYEG